MNSKASKRPKNTQPNRSVYVIGSVPREFLTKEDSSVASGTGCPGSRRGPRWCHGFCQRENKVITA